MFLKSVVDGILAEQNRSLSWLAAEMGKTFDGLRLSLIRGSIKYLDLQKMAKILNVPVSRFFTDPAEYDILIKTTINEPLEEYNSIYKTEFKSCQEMVETLKSQIKDKDKIIALLSK
ncbi:hypothetical protein [Pedobacter sp.]|uniref:hypothetical protein n=1 Tax=Pedobacter sp. TaxID=1411316 RepID=UPI00396C2FB6